MISLSMLDGTVTDKVKAVSTEFMERVYLGNTYQRWLIAACVLIVLFIGLGVIKRIVVARLSVLAARTETEIDDLIVDLVRRTKRFFIFVLALYVAHHMIDWTVARGMLTPEKRSTQEVVVHDLLLVAFCLQCGLWGGGLVAFGIGQLVKGKSANDPARTMGSTVLSFVGNVVVWTIVLLSGLQALEFPVSTFIASLGVGGIAVALALQNILGDLFASISILLDKPFVIGDGIQIGEFSGSIERIGVKSTRLRSVNGEEIIMGNHDLVASRIRNFKRSQERRIVLTLGVEYETPPELVARIPDMIKAIVADTPGTRFDRAHFKSFADSSLQFEAVYFSKSSDYVPMMDAQQSVNLGILRKFAAEGIEFAFPTQTVRHVDLMPVPALGEARDTAKPEEAVLAQREMKVVTEKALVSDARVVDKGSAKKS